MYVEFLEFVRENKGACIGFIVIVILCAICSWVIYDADRNAELYDGTNGILERIESGIESAGDRVDSGKQRVEEAEKTVSSATERIERSEGAAAEIAGGIETCERRLDDCVQRTGRIKNILQDIEAEHRQRTQGASAAGLAK